jgi:hypothetical protein
MKCAETTGTVIGAPFRLSSSISCFRTAGSRSWHFVSVINLNPSREDREVLRHGGTERLRDHMAVETYGSMDVGGEEFLRKREARWERSRAKQIPIPPRKRCPS